MRHSRPTATSLTGSPASLRVSESAALALARPLPGPHPASGTAGVGRTHSSPVPGWAGRAAGPRPWPGQTAAGKPATRPSNPDTRLSFRQAPFIRREVALAGPESCGGRKECARLPKEVGRPPQAQARGEACRTANSSLRLSGWGRLSSPIVPLPQPLGSPTSVPCRPPRAVKPALTF